MSSAPEYSWIERSTRSPMASNLFRCEPPAAGSGSVAGLSIFWRGIGEGVLRIMQRQMKITQGGEPQSFEASSELIPGAIGVYRLTSHICEWWKILFLEENMLGTMSSTQNFPIWSRCHKIKLILSQASSLMNASPGSKKAWLIKKWIVPPPNCNGICY